MVTHTSCQENAEQQANDIVRIISARPEPEAKGNDMKTELAGPKSQGKRCRSRINATLCREMLPALAGSPPGKEGS